MKRPFHEAYALVVCNHGPKTWGRARDSRANKPFFTFTLRVDIPRQTWQCNVKHTRLRGKPAMVLPTCCPHRELQIKKNLNPCCPRGWGRGEVTDNWYITKYLFSAYKKQKRWKLDCANVQYDQRLSFPPLGYVL